MRLRLMRSRGPCSAWPLEARGLCPLSLGETVPGSALCLRREVNSMRVGRGNRISFSSVREARVSSIEGTPAGDLHTKAFNRMTSGWLRCVWGVDKQY